ncbi:MAG: TonB-dependent receptor [Acidobacteria bacterium]|nr:TonB-dependent receptor [Acidobacteriota bacterium]
MLHPSTFAFIGVLLLSAVTPLFAQSDAEIGGTVRDPSGGLIPGVSVTVTRLDTGTVRTTITNNAGFFVVPLLQPGLYSIRLNMDGFKQVTQTGILLQVNEQARLEFQMEVGSVVEEVKVTARAPLLETASAARGQVIDNQKIAELPLNGRDYLQLALISAGVGRLPPGGRFDTFSASGQRAQENTYLLDGVDNNTMQRAAQARRAEVIKPSIDAIQEFKVLTNAYSAEYGRAGGAVVTVNIKSGGNELHGALFEFVRNEKLDAKNFFDPPAQPRLPFKRNQFGFAAGGPIRRDRTFVFGDYEWTRIRESRTVLNTIPVPRFRSGDFGELLPGATTYDPATYNRTANRRDPFPGNVIPSARFDSIGAKLAGLYPQPNLPGFTRNFLYTPPANENINRYDIRLDHNVSDNDRLFTRYSDSANPVGATPSLPEPAFGGTTLATPFRHTGKNLMAGYNRVVSARLLIELKAAWNEVFTVRSAPIDYNVNAQLGLKGVELVDPGMAQIDVTGYTSLGLGANIPNYSGSQNRQLIVNLTSIRGTHTLKWGANLNWLQHFLTNSVNAPGQFQFDGRYTRDTQTLRGGSSVADLLLGTAYNGNVSNWFWMDQRRPFLDFFIQDEWRVTSRLTLTPGLRYELHPEWVARYNKGANMDFSNPQSPKLLLYQDGSRFDRSLVHTDANDFGPRMGFAYRWKEKMVIRSGYGIYYGNTVGGVVVSNNPPFQYSANVTPDPVIPSLFLRDGFPPDLVNPRNARNIAFATTDMGRRNPYIQQWNLTVQRELPVEMLLEVGYVGASSHKLRHTYNINTPPPGPGAINSRRPIQTMVVPPDNVVIGPVAAINYETGNSNQNYHGLQLRFEKRLSRGLSLTAGYIFSKTIGDEPGGFGGGGNTSASEQNIRNFRAERAMADEHIKHRFVANYIYDLPFGRGRALAGTVNRLADAFIGGWSAAGIVTLSSGLRVDVTVTGNPSNTGTTNRPNVVHEWRLPASDQRSLDRWFDTTAFAPNAAFTFGNAGRNLIDGPPLVNFDLALYKSFHPTERVRVQLRGEAFNSTNTPYFGSPNGQVGNPNFGQISSAGRPRNLQIGLKVVF